MKKIAILQSNYIPWKGYFDLIAKVDEFIFYDEMQYTKNDWRNRNKIKTPSGLQWLTIPVETKNKFGQKIIDVKISDNKWINKHITALKTNYARSSYFKEYSNDIFELYENSMRLTYLSEINLFFISKICRMLGIKTKFSLSTSYQLSGDRTERLINICQQCNANEYVSGPSAKDYIDENIFCNANIKLTWMEYNDYREYNQLFPPFEHNVSIVDLIFNCGPNSKLFLKNIK